MKSIKEVRKKLKWSRERLARELKISAKTIERWEKGINSPSQMAMEKINDFVKKHS